MAKTLDEQIVTAAKLLVADRSKRLRGIEAVNVAGEECDPCSPDAVRFCAIGALIRASFDLTANWEQAHTTGWRLAGAIERANGIRTDDDDGYGLVKLSDDRGLKAVLAAFDGYLMLSQGT